MKKNVIKKPLKRVLFLGIKGFLTVALNGFIVPAMAQTGAEICAGTTYTIGSVAPASGAPTYQWLEDGVPIPNTNAAYYTVPADKAAGSYVYTRQAKTADCPLWQSSNDFVVTVNDGFTPAGATVTFEAFAPCENAAVGTEWFLTDSREMDNQQTYKVKKLADGHIWMVQDLKFGNQCGVNFTGSSGTDQTEQVSDIDTYYGDCTTLTDGSTPPTRGYLYDWAATINKSGAYSGNSTNVGCSGSETSACQGICPPGWHIPTGGSAGEFNALLAAAGSPPVDSLFWSSGSEWGGVLGGAADPDGAVSGGWEYGCYWTSTMSSRTFAYALASSVPDAAPGTALRSRTFAYAVRCLRNY
jgi:uncharacterized protein (TIGR02145 family)